MKEKTEKIPDPKEIEKELSEFLSKKFGGEVKIISPVSLPQESAFSAGKSDAKKTRKINFDLRPEELISHLDQYIEKQDAAKAVLATKICTHFNRISRAQNEGIDLGEMVGHIKNNILMIGPTGVGKTYMVKLIAKKLGVPFVKGDATKFSETGYVGGDVEDLIRDLVKEAEGDIELAQCGIVYLDEIDKIASSRNLIGADVSRTGVQRALLKPMEDTDVELKAPHDPISMMQEIEHFRKTGKREKRTVNTRNILFIMSGAFGDLHDIIKKRIVSQKIGFGSPIIGAQEATDILKQVRTEDVIEFGFESEFVGRLPVIAIFERLTREDLYNILKNPNNPVILSKKHDFAAYGISAKFDDDVLKMLAEAAFGENTGARGLVSAVEKALLQFEKRLPSMAVRQFPVTASLIRAPGDAIERLRTAPEDPKFVEEFDRLAEAEKRMTEDYIKANSRHLSRKYNMMLSPSRIDIVAAYCGKHVMEVGTAIQKIKSFSDDLKKIELYFYNTHDINIVLEEDAVDFVLEQLAAGDVALKDIYRKLTTDLELGLKLVREKTGKNRFFLTKQALLAPESFISRLIKENIPEKAAAEALGKTDI